MMKFYRRGFTLSRTEGSGGFTLIELLVVIAIIGILSSVVLASLNSARKKGRDARRIADIKQLQLALELYYDANSQYPSSTTAAALVDTGYIATLPADPQTGLPYTYAALGSSACTSYHLGANLETIDHTALDGDNDAAAGTACSGSPSDFGGDDDENCAGQTGACFDVKP